MPLSAGQHVYSAPLNNGSPSRIPDASDEQLSDYLTRKAQNIFKASS